MKRTAVRTFSLLVILSALLAACYWQDDVPTSSVGIKSDGGKLDSQCLPPGIYSDSGFYSDLIEVPVYALTFEVTDDSVATKDTQLVGVDVAVQVQRKGDCDSVRNLLTNWPALLKDDELQRVVTTQVSQGIKTAVRQFSLNGLLDDRNGMADLIRDDLDPVAAKFSVDVLNVSVKNIALDPEYEAKLQEKARVTVEIEIAQRNQDKVKAEQETARIVQEQRAETLAAQLIAEQAQTNVEVEIASREGKKIDAANKVYQTNEQAFELERLNRLAAIFGSKTQFYYLPVGTDPTLILNQAGGQVVPIPQAQPTAVP